jgi:CheY-like chemotaxis protein
VAKRILLADDSLTIQKVVELTFSDSEYELICVPNGQRALDRVREQAPDLILADVVMPEKNGYEVCEAIKANPATARIPVILLSGTFEPFDRDRAERLGCDAIVSKPFDSQQLLRQVEALLAREPRDTPSASTMAIPIMAPEPPAEAPAPPPPAAPAPAERQAPEGGFSAEDFTGSIPQPANIPGGPDLFEEEYGQADVESAIAAFEKAHPEFSFVEDAAATAAMVPGGSDASDASANAPEAKHDDAPSDDRGWLHEAAESEEPAAASTAAPPPAPAPFWVPRQPEPELAPIPFAADDSASHRKSQPERADEGPTQAIRLSADYVAFRPAELEPPPPSSGRITDETSPEMEEHTEEIPIMPAAVAAEAAAEAPSTVPPDIEELASTTSIGQLKEMFSSVSRPEGGGLTEDEIDRLASRVVERLSDRIVREIAWEVIPDMAELVIKQRIKELEAGVE